MYPHMVVPLFVGRKPSILALEDAMAVGKEILLVAQRKPEVDDPEAPDIYRGGHAGQRIADDENARTTP